jgi:hypothetical protein
MQGIDWHPTLRAMALFAVSEGIATSCSAAVCLGISLNELFSILFCVLLCLFAIVFAVIAWKASEDRLMRIYAIGGAILMPIAGACCIIIDEDFVTNAHPARKTPAFMFVATGIIINFVINIIQLVKCLRCYQMGNRLLTNPTQVNILLIANIVMGFALGLIFGLIDPEGEGPDVAVPQWKMTVTTVIFLFVGLIVGAGFGFYNEDQTQQGRLQGGMTENLKSTDYDQM